MIIAFTFAPNRSMLFYPLRDFAALGASIRAFTTSPSSTTLILAGLVRHGWVLVIYLSHLFLDGFTIDNK
jgi:hypothetical protein